MVLKLKHRKWQNFLYGQPSTISTFNVASNLNLKPCLYICKFLLSSFEWAGSSSARKSYIVNEPGLSWDDKIRLSLSSNPGLGFLVSAEPKHGGFDSHGPINTPPNIIRVKGMSVKYLNEVIILETRKPLTLQQYRNYTWS